MSTQTHTPHEAAMLKVICHLGQTDGKTQQMLDWMAAPLVPGARAKLTQAMALVGSHYTHGRNILQQSLADIYHEEAFSIGTRSLAHPSFLIPAYIKLLTVYADNYWAPEGDSEAVMKAYLKSLITNDERIGGTEARPEPIPNHLNIIFCTGAANPFNSEDRRFFLVEESKPLQLTSDENYLLSYSNRLERALALKNLLRRHQITPGFA